MFRMSKTQQIPLSLEATQKNFMLSKAFVLQESPSTVKILYADTFKN